MSGKPGPMIVRILDDGSVKIETDSVTPAAHVRAERCIAEIAKTLGSPATRARKPHAFGQHTHDHATDHDHTHEGA